MCPRRHNGGTSNTVNKNKKIKQRHRIAIEQIFDNHCVAHLNTFQRVRNKMWAGIMRVHVCFNLPRENWLASGTRKEIEREDEIWTTKKKPVHSNMELALLLWQQLPPQTNVVRLIIFFFVFFFFFIIKLVTVAYRFQSYRNVCQMHWNALAKKNETEPHIGHEAAMKFFLLKLGILDFIYIFRHFFFICYPFFSAQFFQMWHIRYARTRKKCNSHRTNNKYVDEMNERNSKNIQNFQRK